MLGNPLLDRESVIDYTRAFYSWGLIDEQGALAAEPLQKQFQKEIDEGNAQEAYKVSGFDFWKFWFGFYGTYYNNSGLSVVLALH